MSGRSAKALEINALIDNTKSVLWLLNLNLTLPSAAFTPLAQNRIFLLPRNQTI